MSASQHPSRTAAIGRVVWLDLSLIAIGMLALLGALALLSQKWAWTWRSRSGATYSLAQMHAACTSTLGELSQAASGRAASTCLRIDGTWTIVIGLLVAGIVVGVIGVARLLIDTRRLWTPRRRGAHARATRWRAGSRLVLMA
jgi:hypothetical protein